MMWSGIGDSEHFVVTDESVKEMAEKIYATHCPCYVSWADGRCDEKYLHQLSSKLRQMGYAYVVTGLSKFA